MHQRHRIQCSQRVIGDQHGASGFGNVPDSRTGHLQLKIGYNVIDKIQVLVVRMSINECIHFILVKYPPQPAKNKSRNDPVKRRILFPEYPPYINEFFRFHTRQSKLPFQKQFLIIPLPDRLPAPNSLLPCLPTF